MHSVLTRPTFAAAADVVVHPPVIGSSALRRHHRHHRNDERNSYVIYIRRLWGHLPAFEARGSFGRIVSVLHPVRS